MQGPEALLHSTVGTLVTVVGRAERVYLTHSDGGRLRHGGSGWGEGGGSAE